MQHYIALDLLFLQTIFEETQAHAPIFMLNVSAKHF